MNVTLTVAHSLGEVTGIITVIGSSKVISTSNTRNTTAIRKNWREKGIRAVAFGSNPHSNGEGFSRSVVVFFDRIEAIIMMTVDSTMHVSVRISTLMIAYSIFGPFDWKSNVHYTKKAATSSVDGDE